MPGVSQESENDDEEEDEEEEEEERGGERGGGARDKGPQWEACPAARCRNKLNGLGGPFGLLRNKKVL